MKELDHETGKSLECSGNADCWANFDQHALCGVYIDLQLASLIDGGVEESKQALNVEVSSPTR